MLSIGILDAIIDGLAFRDEPIYFQSTLGRRIAHTRTFKDFIEQAIMGLQPFITLGLGLSILATLPSTPFTVIHVFKVFSVVLFSGAVAGEEIKRSKENMMLSCYFTYLPIF